MAKAKARRRGRDVEVLKEDTITLLAKGYGWTATCKKLNYSRSWGYKMRKDDPNFDREVKRLLSSPLHQQRIAASKATSEAGNFKDWRRQFAAHLQTTGDWNMALNAVSRTAIEVEDLLNPENADFDEELAALVREVEVRRIHAVDDAAHQQAIKNNNAGMQRFLLQNLMREKYGNVKKEGDKTLNLYWFSKEQEHRAFDIIDSLMTDESSKDAQRLLEAG
jgi:hypothetical protein